MKLFHNSSLLTSVFIPKEFNPKLLKTVDGTLIEGEHFEYEEDNIGRKSIIKLIKLPYIDLDKYDHQRKKWYHVDKYDNLWRWYEIGEWQLETGSINDNSRAPNVVSVYGLYMSKMHNLEDAENKTLITETLKVKPFAPITIRVNDWALTDISKYSGATNIQPKLNIVDPELNKEFYYNMGDKIYTNQDFALYGADNIKISYSINVDTVQVSCRMNTNLNKLSPYTPVVDFFIVKLTGQNL